LSTVAGQTLDTVHGTPDTLTSFHILSNAMHSIGQTINDLLLVQLLNGRDDDDGDDAADDDDAAVMKGVLALKLAQVMVELFRGNQRIIDEIAPEQLDAFASQLRATKVTTICSVQLITFQIVRL